MSKNAYEFKVNFKINATNVRMAIYFGYNNLLRD